MADVRMCHVLHDETRLQSLIVNGASLTPRPARSMCVCVSRQ